MQVSNTSIKKKAYEVEKAHQSNLVSYSRQLSILKMQRKYQSPVDWVGAVTLQILETQEADGVGYTVAEIVDEAVSLHEILDTRSIIDTLPHLVNWGLVTRPSQKGKAYYKLSRA